MMQKHLNSVAIAYTRVQRGVLSTRTGMQDRV